MSKEITDPDERPPYRVEPEGDKFRVVDLDGNVIIVTSASANAGQYAVLMNQSYRCGYRAGFRDAKRKR